MGFSEDLTTQESTTTTTTTRAPPTTTQFESFTENIFIPTVRPVTPVSSNVIDPLEGDDEQFEYVYYEYYYDYEYEDEDDPLEAPRAFVDLSQDKSPRPTGFSVAQAEVLAGTPSVPLLPEPAGTKSP